MFHKINIKTCFLNLRLKLKTKAKKDCEILKACLQKIKNVSYTERH